MPVPVPTAAEFKTRYPAFAPVGDGLVDAVIGEALALVSDRWIAADQKPAVMCAAAHLLALDGHGGLTTTVGGASIPIAGPIDAVQVGDVRTSFSDKARPQFSFKSASDGGFGETPYGRRFLEMRRRNAPAVLTV